jgi:excisionase family DNA binding protein
MKEIKPDQVYTTGEAQNFLRVSNSTIKRFLKRGILKANKVGGRYRVLGRELLRLVSPEIEEKAIKAYQGLKQKTKKTIKRW